MADLPAIYGEKGNENMENEVMTMTENTSLVADLTSAQVSFCSLNATTPEEKKALFTAMNNPSKKLDECINMVIPARDIYVETIEYVDETTGTVTVGPRIVIIAEDGTSYGCCSYGVFNAIKKLIRVFGEPTWDEPINVVPYTIPSKRIPNGKVLSLRLAD